MTRKLLSVVLLFVLTVIPLKTANALSLAYVVEQQELTIELGPDGSAKIEDRIRYSGPSSFQPTYTIYSPSNLADSTFGFSIEELNLAIEVVDLETGKSQMIEASDHLEDGHYYAYPEQDTVQIEIPMFDQGYKFELVFRYEFENFVTNYQDVAVIDTLKAAGGPLQQYTQATVRLILPGALDFSADQAATTDLTNVEEAVTEEDEVGLPSSPTFKQSTNELAHFSEKLPGDLWAWLFYAEKAQLTLEPGDEQTVMQIHFPKIGLGEPTEIQIATPVERFPANPYQISEPILDELMATNHERMQTAEPYEDIW